jgi:hypothetical protein
VSEDLVYLNTETAQLLVDERLHQATRRHAADRMRDPHRWRRRVGAGLISLGRSLADDRS